MMVAEILLIFLVSLLLVWLFARPLGRPGPWGGILWFFVVVFFGTWAIVAWVDPVGPMAWGVSWVPIVIGALLIALLLAAIPPRDLPPPARSEAVPEVETAAAFGVFFWLLLFGLVVVILFALVFP